MAAENGILGRGEDAGVARRNVLKRSGALAAAWVIGTVGLAAHAQQRDRPRKIGVIMNYAENDLEGQARFSALREQLHKLGSVDGNNTQIEVRWAAGKSDLMLAFATQFVSQPVDVIVVNSTPLLTVLSACDPKRLRPRISAAVYPTTLA
jgi:putative ABC transport system substrate-binding protein